MDRLSWQFGYRYIVDFNGLIYISQGKPTYSMTWVPGLWSYRFPYDSKFFYI